MAVEAQTVQFSYIGDGVSTVFPFPSKFLSVNDIAVGVAGEEIDSGFTVNGAGDEAGGNVTFTTAPLTGLTIDLIRRPPISQLLDFVNGQTVLENTLDTGLDKLTMILQFLNRRSFKSVRLGDFDAAALSPLPKQADRANKYLVFGPTGDVTTAGPSAVNVVSGAEDFATVLSAIGAVLPVIQTHFRVAGYYAAGDGGGGLYRIVATEPAHAGKIDLAGAYWGELVHNGEADPRQLGAKFDGSYDDYAAIMATHAMLALTGGVLRLPAGRGLVSQPLDFITATSGFRDNKRVSVIGAGGGLTWLKYTGAPGATQMVLWGSDDANDTDGTYGNSWTRIGGFFLEVDAKCFSGLRVFAKSWFMMDDIRVLGAISRNFDFQSCVSFSGRGLRSYGAQRGMHFELGSDPLSFSIPNAITLVDCTIGNATEWGLHARNPGPITFIGGSIEACGSQGVDASGGVYLIRNDTGIGVEACAANFLGTYFEANRGGGDIYCSQQSTNYTMILNTQGCNFNRISNTGYTTNNIRLENVGTQRLIWNGNDAFNNGPSYTPSAARRAIALTGDASLTYANFGNSAFDGANVDGPSDLNGSNEEPESRLWASVKAGLDGTVLARKNTSAVSKLATGRYRWFIIYPVPGAHLAAVSAMLVGGDGWVSLTAENADSFTLETRDAAGTLVDAAFSATLHIVRNAP